MLDPIRLRRCYRIRVRITFLVNLDLYSNYALNLLLPALSQQHDLIVFYSSGVGTPPQEEALQQLRFFEQTLPVEILFPVIDRLARSGPLRTFNGLSPYLASSPTALEEPNSEKGLSELTRANPDLIISIRYGRILKREAIDIPTLGVLNLHSGKLPDYRGVMATFRAMMAGDHALSTTLHWIDDNTIDTGRIIRITSRDRDEERCYLSAVVGLYEWACPDLLITVEEIARGDLPDAKAATELGEYYSYPTSDELTAFTEAGLKWIDARWVTNFLRRYQPT